MDVCVVLVEAKSSKKAANSNLPLFAFYQDYDPDS